MTEQKILPVDLIKQYNSIKPELDKAVSNVLQQGKFILGNEVQSFEKEFASYCDCSHAIGTASGTDAIFLALKALGIGKGDEVITCSNSFISTALSISHTGAKPVFVDVSESNFNINPELLDKKITKKTKAIIPVHLFGQSSPMDEVLELAEKHSLPVIEDACQAHGALYKNKKIGSLATIACFSFYPTKNLGCFGDGGIVTTNDDKLSEKLKLLRNYGETKPRHSILQGFNSRLDELQAAILRVKLKKLDNWNEKRRENASSYNKLLSDSGLELPAEEKYAKHVYYNYVLKSGKRDLLKQSLALKGITAQVLYPVPIHLQQAYSNLGLKKGSLPVTEKLCSQVLSLPVSPEISEEQLGIVAKAIAEFKNSSLSKKSRC